MKRVLFALFGLLLSVPAHAAALPSGYTELSYISTETVSGRPYIDTGLTAGSNTRILARYKLQNTGFSSPISVRDENSAGAGFGVGCNGSQQFISDYNGDRKVFTTITPNTTDIITVDKNKNVCTITIGGQSETVTNTASTFTTTNTLPFFAQNSAGNVSAGYYTFYSFKMWDNGTLVRDMIPAKNSSGVVGMYDTVSGQFFTNSGSGSFLPGEELSPCRNLFDRDAEYINAYVNVNTGILTEGTTQYCFVIPVQPNTKYTLSGMSSGSTWGAFTDNTIGTTATSKLAGNGTITTGANDRYLIGMAYATGSQYDYRPTLQIEQGDTATAYTPYDAQCGGCSGGGTRRNYVSATGTGTQVGTPTPENPIDPVFFRQGRMILRAVGSDENIVADSYDASTGKITRRVGMKVLDGTEDGWNKTNNSFSNSTLFADKKREKSTLFCSHFQYNDGSTATIPDGCIGTASTSTTVYFRDNALSTVEDWQQYLASQYAAGTPVIIYYPLATPVEENWTETSWCESGIKIATNLYNSAKFQNVIDALDTAVSTINNIVAGTIAQANSIGELASGKQTRPNPNDSSDTTCPTSCPNYRQCLLVEKDDGTPCWYPINDPWYDFTKPILATSTNAASTSYTQGYQQLEYIESSGTQYIDTGIKGNMGIKADIDFSVSNVQSTNFILAARKASGSDTRFYLCTFSTGGTGQFDIALGKDSFTPGVVANQRYNYFMDTSVSPATLLVDGSVIITNTNTYNTDLDLYMFANNLGGTASFGGATPIRIYYTKIYENNTLVRDFVPVIQQSTGKYGMYDKVYGVFYPNAAASGNDFTPGPIVENDPGVPRGLWSATWANNSTTGVVGGTASGNARCTNVAGSNGAVATAAQLASSAWNTHGRYCWCNLASITIDNAVTPIANGKWVKADAAGAGAYACEMNCSKNYCKSFVATTANLTNLFTTY